MKNGTRQLHQRFGVVVRQPAWQVKRGGTMQERRNTTVSHVAGMTQQIMAATQDLAIASQ